MRGALMAVVVALGAAVAAGAHEVRPALLQITQRTDGRYDILWKQPVTGALALHLEPRLSGVLPGSGPGAVRSAAEFQIREWRDLDLGAQGLQGRRLEIEGLNRTVTDALVSITLADGGIRETVFHPRDAGWTLNLGGPGPGLAEYFRLGVLHILTGVDHLCFVLGLMLLVRRRLMLVKTITAFTIAHSLTLAATTLHWITVEPPLVEALVALSILFLAVELAHAARGETTLTGAAPWAVALLFGLLHGTAFAGALIDVGLPSKAIPASLLLFNAGVECGQLLFVAAVLCVQRGITRWRAHWPAWLRWAPAYAIGSLAAVWFLQRLAAAVT
jgi:hydrogenase/urease accessory protein HupE